MSAPRRVRAAIMNSLRNTSEGFDNEAGVESYHPIDPNPAGEQKTALHEIGRIERNAAVSLGTGGDRQADEIAVGAGAGQQQGTKSLRSSPLRGAASGEAGDNSGSQ